MRYYYTFPEWEAAVKAEYPDAVFETADGGDEQARAGEDGDVIAMYDGPMMKGWVA